MIFVSVERSAAEEDAADKMACTLVVLDEVLCWIRSAECSHSSASSSVAKLNDRDGDSLPSFTVN